MVTDKSKDCISRQAKSTDEPPLKHSYKSGRITGFNESGKKLDT